MATLPSSLLTRPVFFACLAVAVFGVACYGRVLKHERNASGPVRPHGVTDDSDADRRPHKGSHRPSPAERWRLLSRRLSTLLHMKRTHHTAPASAVPAAAAAEATRDLTRRRRSHQDADTAAAQQREVVREIQQVEAAAGRPSDEQTLEQEREIAREIQEMEDRQGPAHRVAQAREVVSEITEIERRAGRPSDADKLDQEREIAREIKQLEQQANEGKLAQEEEIARQIADVERRAGRPSDEDRREQEREIAREIEAMETQAELHARPSSAAAAVAAQERQIADDIRRIVAGHPGMDGRTGDEPSNEHDSSSRQSHESQDSSGDVSTGDVTGADVTGEVDDDNDDDDGGDGGDDDKVYDDFFGPDSPPPVWSSDGDDMDQMAEPAIEPAAPDAAAGRGPGPLETAAAAQGAAGTSSSSSSSWQVTAMTVTMCAIIGVVLLVVVGVWMRHLGYRQLLPGKAQELLLDDDEAIYNNTTQPEPSQVGQYAPLRT